MTEPKRIIKLFEDLFNGAPWIDVNIATTLQELSWRQAGSKPLPHLNSVWEIVNHLISWRETILKRMSGETVESPEDNYFSSITNFSPNAWLDTQTRFEASQKQWLSALKKIKATQLDKTLEGQTFSVYELIMGVLQHDAYHLGQIRMLKRFVSR